MKHDYQARSFMPVLILLSVTAATGCVQFCFVLRFIFLFLNVYVKQKLNGTNLFVIFCFLNNPLYLDRCQSGKGTFNSKNIHNAHVCAIIIKQV